MFNSFIVVDTEPYVAGRSFKIKNKGYDVINWGLSKERASFTNDSQVQNSTATTIDIEVTVIE